MTGTTSDQAETLDAALRQAAERGDIGLVLSLVGQGASVGGASRNGWTPLMAAALFGHEEAARVLLEAGADPNQATDSQENPARTALRVAMANGYAGTVALLLRYGAEGNAVGPDGKKPLRAAHEAVKRPNKQAQMREVVAVLEAAGATE